MKSKTHRFTFEKHTDAVNINGTAEVFGPGNVVDAEHFLRGMLGHASLKVVRLKGKVITVRADGR